MSQLYTVICVLVFLEWLRKWSHKVSQVSPIYKVNCPSRVSNVSLSLTCPTLTVCANSDATVEHIPNTVASASLSDHVTWGLFVGKTNGNTVHQQDSFKPAACSRKYSCTAGKTPYSFLLAPQPCMLLSNRLAVIHKEVFDKYTLEHYSNCCSFLQSHNHGCKLIFYIQ